MLSSSPEIKPPTITPVYIETLNNARNPMPDDTPLPISAGGHFVDGYSHSSIVRMVGPFSVN
jgi:hypothetical protein